jgi:hypothetical protein
MSYAARIIAAFGGALKMSAHLSVEGRRYPKTTIRYWEQVGEIPSRHQSWILHRATELGLPVKMKDFFHRPSAPRPTQRKSGVAPAKSRDAVPTPDSDPARPKQAARQ